MYRRKGNGNSKDGKLFYAVILAEQECDLGPIGLDSKPVHSVHYRDAGALVSDYPRVDSIKLLRKNLAPYHNVIRKASEHFTTIPARFGQIARDAGEVNIALRKNYQTVREELTRLNGKVEMGLKVSWNVEDVFQYFIEGDEKLRAIRDRHINGDKRLSRKDLIDFGGHFHKRMSQARERMTREILVALPPVEVRIEDISDDSMIANAMLLIDKALRAQLEESIDNLGRSMGDEYSLELDGPWPPFSFVDRVELHLGG
jgi:macrodomain Ter protein organizer (MatP/YcbG family)